MIYLLYGEDLYSKKQQLHEILKPIEKNSINWIEQEDVNWSEIISRCQTNSLLASKQGIIIDNYYAVQGLSKDELKMLKAYFSHPNPNTILIFNFNLATIEKNQQFFKLIKQKGVIYHFPKSDNVFSETKKMMQNFTISDQDINYFLTIVGTNLAIIENEIKKLASCQTNGKITKEVIDHVCSRHQAPDLFGLVDAIVNKDVSRAFSDYEVLLKYNEEPVKIIITIANQLRLIYQVNELKKIGYANYDIAKKLNVHPYRVKLALQKGGNYSQKHLMFLLNQLADYDIAIKKGTIAKDLAFEYFLLNLVKQG